MKTFTIHSWKQRFKERVSTNVFILIRLCAVMRISLLVAADFFKGAASAPLKGLDMSVSLEHEWRLWDIFSRSVDIVGLVQQYV